MAYKGIYRPSNPKSIKETLKILFIGLLGEKVYELL